MTKIRTSYPLWLLAVTLALLASLAGLALTVAPALAAGPVVNTAVDENDGKCTDGDYSLRDAIATAASGDTITFSSSYTIYLDSPLTISRTVTIDGGNNPVAVSGDSGGDGSSNVQVFIIESSGVATLTHLSIISGTSPTLSAGGGILNDQGTVTVQNCTLSGNSAYYFGGGIMNNKGTATVRNSTLSGNSAGNGANYTGGGGIMNNEGTVTVQNSTFSGNVAPANSLGGGIMNNQGTVTVQNSTFSGNSAGAGGGIRNWGTLVVTNSTFSGNSASLVGAGIAHDYSGGVLMSMSNTIIANSSSGGDCYNYHSVPLNNHNLIEDSSCGPTLSGDPLLGSLADNGGPTWTFALLPGSPAIDQGDAATCPATDQRSMPRPQGGVCDIGAFEVAQPEMAVLGGSPLTLITNGAAFPTTTNHTDFGSTVVVGGQMTHTFTISNSGAYTLSVTSLSLSGANAADFTISSIVTPTTARPGSSVSFNVTFAPQVTGTRVATVTIANDDSDENPYEFAVQGTVNQAPVANAGSDQSVSVGAAVTLDGRRSSDPDGRTPLTYGWTQVGGPAVTFTPHLSMTTFTAPGSAAVLTFTLTVTDSLGLADPTPDEVVVTVRLRNLYLPLIVKD